MGGERSVEDYRDAMRQIVKELDSSNVTLLERLLPEETGLTADLLHPGDDGFEWIARGVIAHLRDRLDFRPVLRAYHVDRRDRASLPFLRQSFN